MKYLYLGAMGEVDREALRTAEDSAAERFGVAVRSLRLPPADFAFDAARKQYGSVAVLEMLARECPSDALKLVALTERDLFIPVLTFVYGHAQLGGRVAVVSLARLRQEYYGFAPDREVLMARTAKEVLHETGHTFGLVHCADRNCAMALSTGIRQIDSKQAAFCAPCTARLGRNPRERI